MSMEAKAAAISLALAAAGFAGYLCYTKSEITAAPVVPPVVSTAAAVVPAAAAAVATTTPLPPPLAPAPASALATTPPLALWKAAQAGEAAHVTKLLADGADKDEVSHLACVAMFLAADDSMVPRRSTLTMGATRGPPSAPPRPEATWSALLRYSRRVQR